MTATCSRAASSVWTTSGSSIAPRRCPGVGRSSRPTARRGWRSTASGCSRSPPSSPSTIPPTPTWRSSSLTHFEWISIAMNPPDADTVLWDDQDGFYYDVMRMPDGAAIQLKVRSLVGLLPLCAATVFDPELLERYPMFLERLAEFVRDFSDALPSLAHLPGPNPEGRRMMSLVDEPRLRRILEIMLDEDEFLGAARDPRDLPAPPRTAVHLRVGRTGVQRPLPPGRVRHRYVRRQLQLARPGVVPDERRHSARTRPTAPLLRRPPQGRVPHRLRDRR